MLNARDTEEILGLSIEMPPTCRGGNSTITRITWNGMEFAVKDYSSRRDAHERMRREVNGLRFLEQAGLYQFPRLCGLSYGQKKTILTWITGHPPQADYASLQAMIAVLQELHVASHRTSPTSIGPAADALVESPDIARQVEFRGTRLQKSKNVDVADFGTELLSTLQAINSRVCSGVAHVTLSPSDFGCHNMLVDAATNRHTFLDLEFFGWDDAHKLTVDTLLHPLASWKVEQAITLLNASRATYQLNPRRLKDLTWLLACKWAAIIAARAEQESLAESPEACESSLNLAQKYLSLALRSDPPPWVSALSEWEES